MTTKLPLVWVQILFPSGLLFSRLLLRPIECAWKDWLVIISIYWMGIVVKPPLRTNQAFAIGTMLYLIAVYLAGQLSYSFSLLGTAS